MAVQCESEGTSIKENIEVVVIPYMPMATNKSLGIADVAPRGAGSSVHSL